jgi:hypothetical protein
MSPRQEGLDPAADDSRNDSGDSGSGQSTKWTVIYILLLLLSIGSLLAGYFIAPEQKSIWAQLLNELGIAGVVAFILALTIERVSAEEDRRRSSASGRRSKRTSFTRSLAERFPRSSGTNSTMSCERISFVPSFTLNLS